MKRLLTALALTLVVAVPALAGAVVVKPMMIYTSNPFDVLTPTFPAGQVITCHTVYEVKGIGDFRLRLDLLDRRGAVVDRVTGGPYMEDETTFQTWFGNLSVDAPETPGYYTLKFVYIDVATGRTWCHRTRLHVVPPPP
jgi:hypothetical protein